VIDLLSNMWLIVTHLAASPLFWVPLAALILTVISVAIGPRRAPAERKTRHDVS
jgi:hypothetical protein